MIHERKITDARTQYGHYECDHCKTPIGYYGAVRLGLTDAGTWVPLAAVCSQCATEGKSL